MLFLCNLFLGDDGDKGLPAVTWEEIVEIISFQTQKTPCLPQWVAHYLPLRKTSELGLPAFPLLGTAKGQIQKQPSAWEGPPALSLSGPHFHSPHTLPETLEQSWVPVWVFLSWAAS